MRTILITGLFLTACQPVMPPTPPVIGDPVDNQCNASGYSNLIGQSADVLAAMTFPAPIRVIKPGMAITMDYSPSRLNIDLDTNNRIARIWCG